MSQRSGTVIALIVSRLGDPAKQTVKEKWRRVMYLKHIPSEELVEVIDLQDVVNPFSSSVLARSYKGDKQQRAERYPKGELVFPSGEALPLCWTQGTFHERIVA
jgi:hypothetical protein